MELGNSIRYSRSTACTYLPTQPIPPLHTHTHHTAHTDTHPDTHTTLTHHTHQIHTQQHRPPHITHTTPHTQTPIQTHNTHIPHSHTKYTHNTPPPHISHTPHTLHTNTTHTHTHTDNTEMLRSGCGMVVGCCIQNVGLNFSYGRRVASSMCPLGPAKLRSISVRRDT
jgi:hypothetical protein